MKPLNKTQQNMLDKSLQVRNRQAIQRLATLDELRIWANSETDYDLPKYEKPPKVKWSYTVKQLMRQLLV